LKTPATGENRIGRISPGFRKSKGEETALKHGFCHLNVVSARSAPDFTSEIVTQLLFGDCFAVIDRSGIFLRICMDYDGYEGWIDGRQTAPLDAFAAPDYVDRHVVLDPFGVARCGVEQVLVVRGSSLPGYADGCFAVGGQRYSFEGAVVDTAQRPPVERILDYARLYLNTPYLWGGRSPCGIDCSGFAQVVFKMAGIRLRRDSSQQIEQGTVVDSVAEVRPGDLVFAESKAGGHVGIALGEGEIIHSSARVRVDRLDEGGIVHADSGKLSHWLVGIRRYL